MIQAVIFDLDGTLVRTERLKAISYARAAVMLCPEDLKEHVVVEAFKEVVGLPRREVAKALMERFKLESKASSRMEEFGVRKPWQAYVQIRLQIYEEMISDPEVLRKNQWEHNVGLLRWVREMNLKTGLATMSRCEQATKVLDILGLKSEFDFVATRDDVERGKPDPEIYLLMANELGVPPKQALVVEDSPSGVEAALRAGMHVVAVGTPFTREQLHSSGLLPDQHIVDRPEDLPRVVEHVWAHSRREGEDQHPEGNVDEGGTGTV